MKKNYLLILLAIISFSISSAQDQKDQLPENAKLISQSCTQTDLFISLIDLDNSELVIVRYSYTPKMKMVLDYKLTQVFRTGIKVDPELQGYIKGEDSPSKEQGTEGINDTGTP